MTKEKLTGEHIRQDLRVQIKAYCGEIIEFSLLYLVIVGVFILVMLKAPSLFLLALFLWLIGSCIVLYQIVIDARRLIWLCRAKNTLPTPVCDTLVRSELVISYFARFGGNGTHRLHFAHYGTYTIPEKNYTWSKTFSMGPMGVFNGAVDGDEFYLVLAKPHCGKILLAYNAKLFALEE